MGIGILSLQALKQGLVESGVCAGLQVSKAFKADGGRNEESREWFGLGGSRPTVNKATRSLLPRNSKVARRMPTGVGGTGHEPNRMV